MLSSMAINRAVRMELFYRVFEYWNDEKSGYLLYRVVPKKRISVLLFKSVVKQLFEMSQYNAEMIQKAKLQLTKFTP